MSDEGKYSENQPIILRNEEERLQNILGYPPGWALRWGITAVFCAVVLFLILGWFVKYPDVLVADAVLITENPPVRLFARTSGKINQLMAEDRQLIEQGQRIAVIENPADMTHVDSLSSLLAHLEDHLEKDLAEEIQLPSSLKLGSLQATYAALQEALDQFVFYEKQQIAPRQISALRKQIQVLQKLNGSLQEQGSTLAEEVALAKNRLDRNRLLLADSIVSEQDFEQVETAYLQYRRQQETLQTQILNNQLKIEQLQTEILTLSQDQSSVKMDKWLAARELMETLESEINAWRQIYLIESPISGLLSLTRVWSPQQFVQINEEIATIVPEKGELRIIGRATLPVQNSGKVQTGMRVNLHLDAYPYQEFGLIRASVKNIALVPDQENYLLEIALPDTLITTYQRKIPFAQELKAKAHIITDDRRILQRIFDRFLSLFRNN